MTILYSGDALNHRIQPHADLASILHQSLDSYGQINGSSASEPVIPPPGFYHEKDKPDRDRAYITAKLFLPSSNNQTDIIDALDTYTKVTGSAPIKHFILSLQDVTFSDEKAESCSDSAIFEAWETFTGAGKKYPGLIEEYGISELSTRRLTELLSSIDGKSEPTPVPTIDHINATDCCALPPGLIKISRERNIKLLAHHDPEDILPKEKVDELSSKLPTKVTRWKWILRFTSIIKDRQILAGNEYLVCLE